eukprot:CAMPEP_0171252362 /NCGR_PEP_ID=MMETSP0790-20130122/51127_1 /TAXON_ID=2925 /ORGANISM="Alexandrium catenella, Strain OF101" /LENGTH=34 /DNA_ID= /DNA_START= /DNA_END= /DNA_ORIENTATION=
MSALVLRLSSAQGIIISMCTLAQVYLFDDVDHTD